MKKLTILRISFDVERTENPIGDTVYKQGNFYPFSGQEVRVNKVAYVTLSSGETCRFDVRVHPEWRNAEAGQTVEIQNGLRPVYAE